MTDNPAANEQPICPPSEIDLKLRLGIFRLLQRKYHPLYGDQSKFLVAGIVNWALAESPDHKEAKEYQEANARLVEEEAGKMHQDVKLAGALSVLYTFTLIWLGPTNPEKSMMLVDRATEMNILIPSARELCPTDNAIQFLSFIDEYAEHLLAD